MAQIWWSMEGARKLGRASVGTGLTRAILGPRPTGAVAALPRLKARRAFFERGFSPGGPPDTKKPRSFERGFFVSGGPDGTRTRDLRRDRPAF